MAPRYVVFAGLAATVSVSNRMLRSGCLGAGVYVGTKVENVLEVANTGPALGTALSATLAGTGVAIARETSASMWASLIKCCEGILACTAMDRSLYICMLRGVAQLPCRVCSEIRGALTSKKSRPGHQGSRSQLLCQFHPRLLAQLNAPTSPSLLSLRAFSGLRVLCDGHLAKHSST